MSYTLGLKGHDQWLMSGHDDAYKRYTPELFSCCCDPTCEDKVPKSELVECTEDCGLDDYDGTGYECGLYMSKEHLQEHINEFHTGERQ